MGSCVLRETIRKGRPRFAPRVSLSIYLSIYLLIFTPPSPIRFRQRECARSHASLDPQRGGDEFELNSEDHKSKHEDDDPGHHPQHRNAKDRSPKDRRPA